MRAGRASHRVSETPRPVPAQLQTLGASARADIEKYLRAATGASEVELQEHADESLLAGMIVRTADQELDTSARSKLGRLSSLNVNTPEKA